MWAWMITPDHEVDLQAPTDWSGEEYIVFSGIDPLGARVEDAIVVTVLPVNQPPWISGVPDIQVRYDLMYEFDLTRYMGDPDDDLDSLAVTTDDPHVAVMGTVLALLYPVEMSGTVHAVEITVSDGEFSDSWTINVTVSDNYPPEALTLDDHSFKEDLPMPYPVVGGLEDLFVDQEGGVLAFEAFSWRRAHERHHIRRRGRLARGLRDLARLVRGDMADDTRHGRRGLDGRRA